MPHFLLSLSNMIAALDMNMVGFTAGTLSLCLVEPAMQPNTHSSHLVVATSGKCLIDWILASFQDGDKLEMYYPVPISVQLHPHRSS